MVKRGQFEYINGKKGEICIKWQERGCGKKGEGGKKGDEFNRNGKRGAKSIK